jgi:hypothetical protein
LNYFFISFEGDFNDINLLLSFNALEGEFPFKEATLKRNSPSLLGKLFYFTAKPIPVCLKQVRNNYKFGRIDFNKALDDVSLWRESKSYLCFEVDDGSDNITYAFSKASKRGNDVYRWRVKNRFSDLLTFCKEREGLSLIEGNETDGFFTRVFKITLTVDRKLYSIDEFNSTVCSHEVDKFVKRIRNNFDREVKVSRTYEVHRDGYLHVNLILFFPNRMFNVFFYRRFRQRSGKNNYGSWRLKEKKNVSDLWTIGFSDVRAISDVHDLIEYCLKYQIKYFHKKANRELQNRTMSVLSLYNKRSYSIPKSFEYAVYAYVNHLKGYLEQERHERSPRRSVQDTLSPEKVNIKKRLDTNKHNSLDSGKSNDYNGKIDSKSECVCTFLGVFHEAELEHDYDFDFSCGWYFYSDIPPSNKRNLKAEFMDDPNFHVYIELCKHDRGSRFSRDGSLIDSSRIWKPYRLPRPRFRTGFFPDKPRVRKRKRIQKVREKDRKLKTMDVV